MNARTIALVLVAIPLLAFAPPAAANADCKTLSGGIYACGEVSHGVCGAGSGTGQATASVQWTLVVSTNHGTAYDYESGSAAALAATAPCWTDTCTTVSLYANGEFIVGSMGVCM